MIYLLHNFCNDSCTLERRKGKMIRIRMKQEREYVRIELDE